MTVTAIRQQTVHCPTCNTEFEKDDAPWTKQRLHCPRHDVLYFDQCEHCTPEEREHDAEVRKKQEHDAANNARVASGQEPVAWEGE